MANIDDILKKSQTKLENSSLRKKMTRTGPTRPWQEGLEEIKNSSQSLSAPLNSESVTPDKNLEDENRFEQRIIDLALKAPESSTINENLHPISDTSKFNTGDLNRSLENLQPTYNKPTSELTTVVQQNLQPTYNKPTTIVQQTYVTKTETYNKLTSEPTTVVQQKPTTVVQQNLQPTYNKPTSRNFDVGVQRLVGMSLKIMSHLFDMCVGNGSRLSGPVSIESITQISSGTSSRTTQTVIYRLEKEGYILRASYKAGRGGWTSYEIPQEIYNQMVKLTTNLRQNLQPTYNKPTSEPTSEPTSHAPSKIDSKNINNLTNYLEREPQTATWFKELDFSKIQPLGPMMVNSSIRALVQQKLNPEVVQDFINRFTSWVATQNRVSSMIGMFCDKLKELANEGDSAVLSCMTEEERQAETIFATHVEKARAEMDLIQKARNADKEQSEEVIFEKWYKTASESEKLEFAEPSGLAPSGSESYKRILKAVYFERMTSVVG